MKGRSYTPAALLPLVLAIACGGPTETTSGDIELPTKRQALITVTPALEVTSLFDAALADRILIDEISLNLAEVRLLGADPRIPAGGYELLGQDRVVRADVGANAAIELPFPDKFLGDDDLAVYLRIARTPSLEGASLVIRGRLYANALEGGSAALTADEVMGTDPDVDPADPAGGGGDDCATDPDVDPADCPEMGMQSRGLVNRAQLNRSVAFELRDSRAADLVAQLSEESALDVVVGIPAAKWFTPDVVAGLEDALVDHSAGELLSMGERHQKTQDDRVIVEARDARSERAAAACRDLDDPSCGGDDVFLTDGRDGLTVRR